MTNLNNEPTPFEKQYDVILVHEPHRDGYTAFCPELRDFAHGHNAAAATEALARSITHLLDQTEKAGKPMPSHPYDLPQETADFNDQGAATSLTTVRRIDWQQLIDDCTAAIAKCPDDADMLLKRANLYLDQGQYGHAIVDYDRIVLIKRDSAEAYCNRGHAYFNTGDYNHAIADYDAALRRDPTHLPALNSLEGAYLALWKSRNPD